MIAKQQYEQPKLQGCYNIGPDEEGCIQTGVLAERFYQVWGQGVCWRNERSNDILHEANYLKLDCSLLKSTFHWKPKMSISRGIERAVEWYKTYLNNGNIADIMGQQIKEHLDC
ncbi:hypothetical protein AGMMS49992_31310 [Clostridia bacterium]|nr:hypothetical protein AGMMS49992_31310 [Clostridia bacterium]